MASFLDDLGSLFTGRWMGGENAIADMQPADLAKTFALPAAAIAAPFAIGALGGAGALGAGAAEAGFGAAEAGGGMGALDSLAAGFGTTGGTDMAAGAMMDPWAVASDAQLTSAMSNPEFTNAFGMAADAGRVTTSGAPIQAFGAESQLPADELAGIGAGGGGPPTTGGGGVFDTVSNFAGKAGNYAMEHPFQTLGVGTAALGLGSALMRGQGGPTANEQNVANMTSAAVQQAQYDTVAGRELQAYLRNGTLPAGMQAQVDKARKAARAAAISTAAKMGQNTNPQNNTQLQQAFEEADRNALILATQMETQLFQQGTAMVQAGLQATQLSMEGYKFLTGVDQQKNRDVTNAMIALAGAFGGGKMNVNLGGSRNA